MSLRFPAATSRKSAGTGSVLTIAPELISLWPVIGNFFSCIAVSSSCCDLGSRSAISSMNSTPLLALCTAPLSTLRWGGVPRPPELCVSMKSTR